MKHTITSLMIIIAIAAVLYFLFIKKAPLAHKNLKNASAYIVNVSFKQDGVYKILVDLNSPDGEEKSVKNLDKDNKKRNDDVEESDILQMLVIDNNTEIRECYFQENVSSDDNQDPIFFYEIMDYDIWFNKFKTSIGIDRQPVRWQITAKNSIISLMQEVCVEEIEATGTSQ